MCVSAESRSPSEKTWRFFTEKDLHQGIENSTIVLILGFPFIGDNLISSRDWSPCTQGSELGVSKHFGE
jgi:hypothetical protein